MSATGTKQLDISNAECSWRASVTLSQVADKPARGDALMDLIHTNKGGLIGDVKLKGSPRSNDHEMVAFRFLRG